ncbi:MFS general substrate transporter [Myriangium duriaei CBS 260.36]|uniref:MFS general substrate transporter n=1 Tax=Myriangium duriaei CBS 260.36 TaxID=1168546 RepID=A0A9P4IVJ8_9PEZI|nr:MFS general substrate transporter [Myriangium duriaei CBS 260.36]
MTADQDTTAPLLGQRDESEPTPLSTVQQARAIFQVSPILAIFSLLALAEFAAVLFGIPMISMYESAICQRYYAGVDGGASLVTGDRCKVAPVQRELALVKGWQVTFEVIPSILTAIPYGRLADTRGRVPVLRWCLIGLGLTGIGNVIICLWPEMFPTRLVCAAAVFMLFGGGAGVLQAVVFTMVADVTTAAQRSIAFSWISASLLVATLVATPMSASLMSIHPWLSVSVGLTVYMGCIVMTYFIRETLKPPAANTDSSSVVSAQDDQDKPTWHQQFKAGLASIASTDLSFLQSWSIAIFLTILLLTTLGRYVQEIILQYATKRFSWSWSQASYLLMLHSLANLLQLTLLIPWASSFLDRRFRLPPAQRDLWLARAVAVVFALGAVLMGLSSTPALLIIGVPLFASGSPFENLIRSSLTSLVDEHHIGALYNVVAMVEYGSLLVAGPVLASAFGVGLERGGAWLGLPFLAAAGLLVVSGVGLGFVRLPGKVREGEVDGSE